MLSQPTYPVLIVNRKRSSCTATKQGVPNDAGVEHIWATGDHDSS